MAVYIYELITFTITSSCTDKIPCSVPHRQPTFWTTQNFSRQMA